ncbi:unnamed protein product [Parascedosporium putredinis]|uniref:acireductone dioxygenase (Fe(2+)-requiring) n=1 Tax=Parascedosporium putredinis TaxID=1442378 RepID=A0A9P1GW77_9PEZI|nr:unnamed protein product [Parascedosporium putredinis]CAI7988533.1 unnamed protein product [Parascedosporium putredinis]
MKAYIFDDAPGDPRLAHDSGREIDEQTLAALGVKYYHLEDIGGVDELANSRGYKNRDEVTISPQAMGSAFEDKIQMFFCEHIHEDEEIRYIRAGNGYFDVRGQQDEWIRIRVEKNDLLILPPASITVSLLMIAITSSP